MLRRKIAGNGSENAVVKAIPKANPKVMGKEEMVVSSAGKGNEKGKQKGDGKGKDDGKGKKKKFKKDKRHRRWQPFAKGLL